MFKIKSRKPSAGTTLNVDICSAVKNKNLIRCTYSDDPAVRILQPHCHGYSHTGNELLSAFQTEPSDTEGHWKMFDVSKMSAIEVLEQTFQPQDDFNPDAPGITQVHCQVEG